MSKLDDLIKRKLVQLSDTVHDTVAPIIYNARTRENTEKEAKEGTERLKELRKQGKQAVFRPDYRTSDLRKRDDKEADYKHQQYQKAKDDLKRAEGFENLMKLSSPSTYVEAVTGLQLTPAGKLATDMAIFGLAGGAKSLLTRGGSKAVSKSVIGEAKGIGKITPENVASITPLQWTAAQDAAIAKGDMAEAQRLRDLHSALVPSATPGKYYRGTQTKRTSYPDRHIDEEVGEMNGIYMTKNPKYAKTYGDVEEFYLHSNNPLNTEGSWTGVIDDATRTKIENSGYDAIVNNRFDTGFLNKLLRNSRDETITFNGKNIKSADAVTYNNGVRIPLGERDNFNIEDIRYFSVNPLKANPVHTATGNPLATRLARLRNHYQNGFISDSALGVLVKPNIHPNEIRSIAKLIDPNLTEDLLDLVAQIAMSKRNGVHIPILNDKGTVNGVSIVDVDEAINWLKQSGITPNPYHVGIIAGHEAGHGVQVSPAARRLVEGFVEPDEFYTRAGQVLDAAGITATADSPVTYNKFVNLIDKYLKQGNLDNGVSELKQFMIKLPPLERQKVMKYINRLSAGTGLAYLLNNE